VTHRSREAHSSTKTAPRRAGDDPHAEQDGAYRQAPRKEVTTDRPPEKTCGTCRAYHDSGSRYGTPMANTYGYCRRRYARLVRYDEPACEVWQEVRR